MTGDRKRMRDESRKLNKINKHGENMRQTVRMFSISMKNGL